MASGTQELERFVRDALASGQPRDAIEQALATAGWPPEQARSALAMYAEVAFPVPVPRPRPYLSAREAFIYLVLFTTLYLSAYHLGSLLFDLLNRAMPDPADSGWRVDRIADSIRWSTASLIIAFPVYVFLAHYVSLDAARNPSRRLSAVRRWLTYLTLFVAASVLMGDLIALVNALLGGELTLRFVLKVLIAGTIAGTIFGFYLWDLRREEKEA